MRTISRIKLLTIIALVVIAALVCFGRLTSAQRSSKLIVSRTAGADAQDTDTFTPKDTVIYAIFAVANPDPKATYKFNWGRYDPSTSTPKTIFQQELTNQNGNRVLSKFTSASDLPPGEYSINLWTGHGHARKVFTVKNN
jgi:hypothetical protein